MIDPLEMLTLLGAFRSPAPGARTCDLCGRESTLLYEINGYTGVHVECPSCFGPEEDDEEEEEIGF